MKPDSIDLPGCEPIPILYEDRSVLAVDKPRGWMLVPESWQRTARNLQAALSSSIAARDFWARSRGIKFLRYVHRLDADTSGVLLFVKSSGALALFSSLFESRQMEKRYLAVVAGEPPQAEWTCRLKLGPYPRQTGRMKVDSRHGKDAESHFRVLQKKRGIALVEARPMTGRTHQLRVHLAEAGLPVTGDDLYGREAAQAPRRSRGDEARSSRGAESPHFGSRGNRYGSQLNLALRAVRLTYTDPFARRRVDIQAPVDDFLREYGFDVPPA